MKKTLPILAGTLILGILTGLAISNFSITGQTISEETIENSPSQSSYTTAICDENKCLDVQITCANNKVTSITPVSDFVNFPDNWEDFRPERFSFCD